MKKIYLYDQLSIINLFIKLIYSIFFASLRTILNYKKWNLSKESVHFPLFIENNKKHILKYIF